MAKLEKKQLKRKILIKFDIKKARLNFSISSIRKTFNYL